MFKHDLEKIGSAVSKQSENIKGFGFSAKNLAENPKKLAGIDPQDPQLFGCMGMDWVGIHTWQSTRRYNVFDKKTIGKKSKAKA